MIPTSIIRSRASGALPAYVRDVVHANGAAIVFLALCAAALAPVLWFDIPAAMVDYPNHLARMFVLSRNGGPHPQPFYQVAWALYPNLAMDLIVPPLGRVIGVEPATRLFYLASQILIITGALAIEFTVKGRVAIAGFVALAFLYSLPFAWGFVNFEFALGCALWSIAGALALQNRGWIARLALHSGAIAGLFLAHMFALGIYGFTIGVHELWRAYAYRTALRQTLARFSLMALPTAVLIGVMAVSGGTIGGNGTQWFLALKPLWILHIVSGYSSIASAVCVAALIILTRMLARHGALRLEQSGGFLAAAFIVLYLAMPSRLFDTSFVDLRVIVAAALIMPAFISVSFPNAAWRRYALATVVVVTIVNIEVVAWVWMSYRADYAAAMDSFRQLPKGATVLIGDSGNGDDPPLGHLADYPIYQVPTLAVQYADAFVPNLFTAVGKQPVSARWPWKRLDIPYGGPAPVAVLKAIAERGAPAGTPRFIRTWPQDFDYLYLVGGAIANPMPDILHLVWRGPRFALYRIRKPAADR
jgi:hypothetical protein